MKCIVIKSLFVTSKHYLWILEYARPSSLKLLHNSNHVQEELPNTLVLFHETIEAQSKQIAMASTKINHTRNYNKQHRLCLLHSLELENMPALLKTSLLHNHSNSQLKMIKYHLSSRTWNMLPLNGSHLFCNKTEKAIFDLKQGKKPASTLVAEFKLAFESTIDGSALFPFFCRSLNNDIKNESTKTRALEWILHLGNWIYERKREKNIRGAFKSPIEQNPSNAMIIFNIELH